MIFIQKDIDENTMKSRINATFNYADYEWFKLFKRNHSGKHNIQQDASSLNLNSALKLVRRMVNTPVNPLLENALQARFASRH